MIVANDGQRAIVITNAHVCPRQPTAIHDLQLIEQDQPIMPTAPGYSIYATYPVTVHLSDGRFWGAFYIGAAPKSDLAALLIDTSAGYAPAAMLATAEPAAGAPVYQAGFPGGRATINYRSGTAKGKRWSYQDGSDSGPIFNMQCIGGDSGSGIFDANGRVVGILWGGGDGTCAVSLAQLRSFTEYCRGRWLRPGSGQPGFRPVPGIPSQPQVPPNSPVVPPPGSGPVDPTPPAPPVSPPTADFGPVLQAIAALEKRIASIQLTPGPVGPPGPPGKDGRDGLDADPAELAALRRRLEILEAQQKNAPAYFDIIPRTPKK